MLLLLSRLPWRRLTLLRKLNKVSHAIRALIGINLEQTVWEPVQDWIEHDPIDTADNTGTYRCNKPPGAVKSSCQAMVYCSIMRCGNADWWLWAEAVAETTNKDYKCAANRTPASQTAVFVECFNESRPV